MAEGCPFACKHNRPVMHNPNERIKMTYIETYSIIAKHKVRVIENVYNNKL